MINVTLILAFILALFCGPDFEKRDRLNECRNMDGPARHECIQEVKRCEKGGHRER